MSNTERDVMFQHFANIGKNLAMIKPVSVEVDGNYVIFDY